MMTIYIFLFRLSSKASVMSSLSEGKYMKYNLRVVQGGKDVCALARTLYIEMSLKPCISGKTNDSALVI